MVNAFMTAEAAAELSVMCSAADKQGKQAGVPDQEMKVDSFALEREVTQVLSSVLAAVRDEALQGHFVATRTIAWGAWEAASENRFVCRPKELAEAVAYRLLSLGYRCSIEPDEFGWTFRVCW